MPLILRQPAGHLLSDLTLTVTTFDVPDKSQRDSKNACVNGTVHVNKVNKF